MSGTEDRESRRRGQDQSSGGQQQPRGGEDGLRAALPKLSYVPVKKRRWRLLGKFQQEQGSGQSVPGRGWRLPVPACTEQPRLSWHEQGLRWRGGPSTPHTVASFALLSIPHSWSGKADGEAKTKRSLRRR